MLKREEKTNPNTTASLLTFAEIVSNQKSILMIKGEKEKDADKVKSIFKNIIGPERE